jgi:hypothetical protein
VRRRGWVPYVLFSVMLLAPCYWQPRLQAGDLATHIYNSWLLQLVESGRTEGLMIVRQTTNVLFDLLLSGLFRVLGAEAAQRIAVSLAVLTFVWGAFAFIGAASGRKPWHLLPCVAILAYGWVFHMGFFNFYLSLGLCFWAMALLWNFDRRRILPAAGLFAVAYVAHALPLLWSAGLLAYAACARRLVGRRRAALTAAAVFTMLAAHVAARQFLPVRWSPLQLTISSGVDQVWIFDTKYYIVLVGLLAIWGVLFVALLHARGPREVVSSVPFHVCVLAAAAVFVLPGAILLPGFGHSLSFIGERMSLGVAVCVCALLGAVEPRKVERYALVAVAVLFFAFVYRDERALNAFEERMQDVISELPPGERVVNIIQDRHLRTNSVSHMISRVCIGRCFNYGNYEPSTHQFRVRAARPNPVVLTRYKDIFDLQLGDYVVRPADMPVYEVDIDADGKMRLKRLSAGTRTGFTLWNTLENRPLSPKGLT